MNKIQITELSPENLRELIREEIDRLLQANGTPGEKAKQLLTIDECAEYLGVSKSHLYKLTSRGILPHFKPGKRIYFRRCIFRSI